MNNNSSKYMQSEFDTVVVAFNILCVVCLSLSPIKLRLFETPVAHKYPTDPNLCSLSEKCELKIANNIRMRSFATHKR